MSDDYAGDEGQYQHPYEGGYENYQTPYQGVYDGTYPLGDGTAAAGHGEVPAGGFAPGGGVWQPLAQNGEFDAEATMSTQFAGNFDFEALRTGEQPLAAPGHGYVPQPYVPQHDDYQQQQQQQPAEGGVWHPAAEHVPPQAEEQAAAEQWSVPFAPEDPAEESGEYSLGAVVTPPLDPPAPQAAHYPGAYQQPYAPEAYQPPLDGGEFASGEPQSHAPHEYAPGPVADPLTDPLPDPLTDPLPEDYASGDFAPSPAAPADFPPAGFAPQEYAPEDAPREYTPEDGPQEYVPEDAPQEYTSGDAPREYAPEEAPQEYVPEDAPQEYAPGDGPQEYAPEDYAPGGFTDPAGPDAAGAAAQDLAQDEPHPESEPLPEPAAGPESYEPPADLAGPEPGTGPDAPPDDPAGFPEASPDDPAGLPAADAPPQAAPDVPQDAEDGALPEPHSEHPTASYVLTVNGTDRPVTDAWLGESLLYVLRERLGLAGAKDGCEQGECGACSVQVDGRLVASCLVPAATAAGSEVRTVEGLARDGHPSDVQRALAECGAVQCGFCLPGMAMTVHDLLEGNHRPTELRTRAALAGNLCRCSGYQGVLNAVERVSAEREAAHEAAQEAHEAERQAAGHDPGHEPAFASGNELFAAGTARIPHQSTGDPDGASS
ncbi:2Fe-2S iron-sulfur cluster-binding protein [Streptomyces sp. SL13]|uniref:2Fe-2S iron-sulfur cluster-binding protein n=1 Tax=Streptantibioticus silvisoli TaxID=2705255 RepID=A0AA90H341_9ACTN|nr:(2Fe-2S)-binding protein [Streptantibioticus silvisoli]MDI5972534.1 2Fe-2S iron-sulfur cluster-binding protein [Streptantibioticus silvisoli]